MTLAVFGVSMPVFWSGILLITLFSAALHWLPATGQVLSSICSCRCSCFALLRLVPSHA